jgi:hypothetical protein
MTTLTADQLAYIRRRLGNFESVFSDPELQDYYDDAAADGAIDDIDGAIYYAYDALLTGSVAMTNYTQNASREEKAVIYDRIERMVERWKKQAGLGLPEISIGKIDLNFIENDPDEDDDA